MYNYKKLANLIFITCLILSISIYISRKAEVNEYLIKDIDQKGSKSYKVNINTASDKELTNLPGIGPNLAQTIIHHRNQNGSFENLKDLENVKGIGISKYSKIEKYLTIKN